MIDLDELKNYKKILGFNLGQTEKNYIHTAVLYSISKLFPEKLIFKGGTCLFFSYSLNRFSEDLDFNLIEEVDLDLLFSKIKYFLNNFDIKIEYKIINKGFYNDCFIFFYGPLYKDTNTTRCKIKLDFSKRNDYVLKPEINKINHFYNEFPLFYLKTLNINEIFAEKIRAILNRNKARDVYDLYFLINKNIKFDKELINKKLSLYDQKFNIDNFKEALDNKKKLWDVELKHLINYYPDFDLVYNEIIDFFNKNKIK